MLRQQEPVTTLTSANDPQTVEDVLLASTPDEQKVHMLLSVLATQCFGTPEEVEERFTPEYGDEYEKMLKRFFDKVRKKEACGTTEALVQKMADKIEEFKRSDKKTLFITLNGISGTGKSTLMNAAKEALDLGDNVNVHFLETDWWLGTERSEKEKRALMGKSRHHFIELFYRWEKFAEDLTALLNSNINDKHIFTKLYFRSPKEDARNGTFAKELPITVTGEKHVVILEGFNAMKLARPLLERNDTEGFHIGTIGDPAHIMIQGVHRDEIARQSDPIERFKMRLREFFYQHIETIENLEDVHILFANLEQIAEIMIREQPAYQEALQEAKEWFWNEFIASKKYEKAKDKHLFFVMKRIINRIEKILNI